MGLSKINKMIMDAFKGEKGAGKNLIILGSASLVTSYLFAAVTLGNIREQEREAHYYNATQMAEGIKFKIDTEGFNKEDDLQGKMKDVLDTQAGVEIFSIGELVHKKLLKVAPDATSTRLNGNVKKYYDADKSIVKVMFLAEGGSNLQTDSNAEFAEIRFQVDLVSSPYAANDSLSTAIVAGSVIEYINMLESGNPVNGHICAEGVNDILDTNFVISEKTVPLMDDAAELAGQGGFGASTVDHSGEACGDTPLGPHPDES